MLESEPERIQREDVHTLFANYLSRRRLKMTAQRRLILDIFLENEGHLTPEDIYAKAKAVDCCIGQATVYRTLKLLSAAGLAKEVRFGDGVARYEHLYGRQHHDHLLCEGCGKNIEVVDEEIERLQEALAGRHGFVLTGHRMNLYGLCRRCRERGRQAAAPRTD